VNKKSLLVVQKKGGKKFPAFFIYSLPSSIALCAQPKANLTGACPDYFCQNVMENLI
jgi:hypothetical protein